MSETSLGTDDRNAAAPAVASAREPALQPAAQETTFRPLEPQIITAERISNWIFFAVVAIGGLLAQAIYLAIDGSPGLISVAIAVVYGLLLAFLVWGGHFYPAQAYRHAAWRCTEQGLEIRRGVWWRHEITIPRARVQHIDVHQGPLMRKFGLARLVIHTAGTQNASIALDGLSFETAQKLRSELVADCDSPRGETP